MKESKKVVYREVTCKSGAHYLKKEFPYPWDLNCYRGCSHGCRYCFAMYSHDYVGAGADGFFREVYVKTNVAEMVDRQLGSRNWKGQVVNLGGVTDSYQEGEREYRLMPEILKLMIKYKNPIIVSTKSDLILRDYDLIAELAGLAYVNVACTITAVDEEVREALEPGAVSSDRRFEVLKAFGKTEASVGLHVMPVIPLLTDGEENLRGLYERGMAAGVDYLLPGSLNLRGMTKGAFLHFVREEYPGLYGKMVDLYRTGHLDRAYKREMFAKIGRLQKEFGLYADWRGKMPGKQNKGGGSGEQLSFFSE